MSLFRKQRIFTEQSGRIGEPMEYTEFRVGGIAFIAQEAGGNWHVYRSTSRSCRVLINSLPKDHAIAVAKAFAKELAR